MYKNRLSTWGMSKNKPPSLDNTKAKTSISKPAALEGRSKHGIDPSQPKGQEDNFRADPHSHLITLQKKSEIGDKDTIRGDETAFSPLPSQIPTISPSIPIDLDTASQQTVLQDPRELTTPTPWDAATEATTLSTTFASAKNRVDQWPGSNQSTPTNQEATSEFIALACPFYQHNPKRYKSQRGYTPSTVRQRACAGPGWESISRLRFVSFI